LPGCGDEVPRQNRPRINCVANSRLNDRSLHQYAATLLTVCEQLRDVLESLKTAEQKDQILIREPIIPDHASANQPNRRRLEPELVADRRAVSTDISVAILERRCLSFVTTNSRTS